MILPTDPSRSSPSPVDAVDRPDRPTTGPTDPPVYDPAMAQVSVVEFTVSRDVAEVVADWLWTHGASAVVEADATESLFPDVVSLTADLSSDLVEDLLADRVTDTALEFVLSARIVGDAADDHLAAQTWKTFAEPVECGRFVIVPEWLDSGDVGRDADGGTHRDVGPRSNTVRLLMDPGDAFGAGTHVTTLLCLEAVADVVRPGDSVLDLGAGTGVLGVAAAMIDAASVCAVDNDPEALRVTRRVADLNGVTDRVTTTSEIPDGRFDVVFANVLITVIEQYGERLAGSVAPGGVIVLSGILVDQADRALAALNARRPATGAEDRTGSDDRDDDFDPGGTGPVVVEEVQRDGWLRIVLRRPDGTRPDYG